MNFWRTLFERQTKPYKPAFPVTGIETTPPIVKSASQVGLGFQTLTFSTTAFLRFNPSSGTINNATAGSVIVPVGLPGGLTINSSARTWTWDGTGLAGNGSFQLYENIPGASTNPNVSTIIYSITAGSGGRTNFASPSQSGLIVLLEDI